MSKENSTGNKKTKKGKSGSESVTGDSQQTGGKGKHPGGARDGA